MSTMIENVAFYPIFVCQILLLSWYFPKLIVQRTDWLLEHCPPCDYPKLYPVAVEHFIQKRSLFVQANHLLLAIGVVILGWVGYQYGASENAIFPMVPWVYFMLQMLPMLLTEIIGFKFFKLMREANASGVRKATLQPRRLFDYVSPRLVGAAVLTYVAMVIYTLTIFDYSLALSDVPVMSAFILLLGNSFFAAIIAFNIYGKKQDPYQDGKDKVTEVKIVLQSLFYMSIYMSVFMAVMASSNRFELDIDSAVFMSLFCQSVALIAPGLQLKNFKLANVNFDVYREQKTPSL